MGFGFYGHTGGWQEGDPVDYHFRACLLYTSGQLGLTVAVGRLGAVGLEDGHALRFAVGRGGRRKDDLEHIVRDHTVQQGLGAAQIAVSYTHLDVYKRQLLHYPWRI